MTLFPSRKTSPASGRYKELITLKSVDFPAPFGPISPRSSTFSRRRLMSLRTVKPPKLMKIPSSRSTDEFSFMVPFTCSRYRLLPGPRRHGSSARS